MITEVIIAAVPTILGIVGTLVAWNFNPRRKINQELDQLFKQLLEIYEKRDAALKANNYNDLTIHTYRMLAVKKRIAVLLQR